MKLTKMIFAGVASLLLSSAANALVVSIDGGANILDGDGDGQISYFEWAGSTLKEISISTSYPMQGAINDPAMHMTIGLFGAGSINVRATDYFTGPLSSYVPFITDFGGSQTAVGHSVEYSLYIGSTEFGNDIVSVVASGSSYGDIISTVVDMASFDLLSGYYLTMEATLSQTSGSSSADYGVEVPEPTSIALLGLGLLGMGAARRRKIA